MTSPSTDRRYGVSPGLGIKAPVVVAAITAITLTGEQTVDGIACVSGDRVLVIGQTDTTANGIYDCDTGAWTRSIDANGNRDFVDGTLVLVNGGTYANLLMVLSATNPIVIGTSALTFLNSGLFSTSHADYTAAGGETVIAVGITYSMGSNALSVFKNGLRQDIGNDFTETSVTSVTFASALSADDVISFYVNQNAGQLILGTVTSDLVTYTPAGSGAQPTTVQTKLRESVSVKDFGADPTGATDSTTAFNNALTANSGGTVVVPDGTYLITSAVTVYGQLVGGRGAILSLSSAAKFVLRLNDAAICGMSFNVTGVLSAALIIQGFNGAARCTRFLGGFYAFAK